MTGSVVIIIIRNIRMNNVFHFKTSLACPPSGPPLCGRAVVTSRCPRAATDARCSQSVCLLMRGSASELCLIGPSLSNFLHARKKEKEKRPSACRRPPRRRTGRCLHQIVPSQIKVNLRPEPHNARPRVELRAQLSGRFTVSTPHTFLSFRDFACLCVCPAACV